ncbi:MAG: hypothetical protein HY047_01630 [Acidobacteria bacterium]|nr:hypothetical protein [Acidobacteriota bacterium]
MLWKRILGEKRALIIPLALGVVANVAAYVIVVRPLGIKSAGAADRAAAAAKALRAADGEEAAARALMAGKAQADQELSTFYDKVLPADQSSARRLTYAMVPELARKTNVKFVERHSELDPSMRGSRLGRLKTRASFQGEYESLRQFIYQLEGAPEFVIIDDVTLAQTDPAKPLLLTLDFSTYFRLGANGR